ncbi:MAG: hypothetical protein IJW49_10235, partial [Clostridia bacterium]|nr:hypothetical protein [Clostridia bacterium]
MKKQTNCTAVPPHPSADKRLPPSPLEKAVGDSAQNKISSPSKQYFFQKCSSKFTRYKAAIVSLPQRGRCRGTRRMK